MADLGFWTLAQKDPSYLALVDPDGREIASGELLAAANQLVHGLRELGLQEGDSFATVLPNGAPMIELYLAALQAGWYLVPINHHLVGPEIAYVVDALRAMERCSCSTRWKALRKRVIQRARVLGTRASETEPANCR